MELRKQREREFSERFRGTEDKSAFTNQKYYSVARQSRSYVEGWLCDRCSNKNVLDYGCGNGMFTVWLGENGANATGVDISDVSFEATRAVARKAGVEKNIHFYVMDCEELTFPDETFDLIVENGVLHHLDLQKAFAEMARVLKKDGAIICNEAVADNPIIQLYRRKTPQMRTKWETEHILRVKDLEVARRFFESVEVRFFHLGALLAVPFRSTFLFNPLLTTLEAFDSVILKLPVIRNLAWQMVFVLSKPLTRPAVFVPGEVRENPPVAECWSCPTRGSSPSRL